MDSANEKNFSQEQWDEKIKEEMTLSDDLKDFPWSNEEAQVKWSEFVTVLRHCFWAEKYMQMEQMHGLLHKKLDNKTFLDSEGNAIEDGKDNAEVKQFLESEIYGDLILQIEGKKFVFTELYDNIDSWEVYDTQPNYKILFKRDPNGTNMTTMIDITADCDYETGYYAVVTEGLFKDWTADIGEFSYPRTIK